MIKREDKLRARFSERNKFVEPRNVFQLDDIDEGLKNRLWNIIQNYYFDTIEVSYEQIQQSNDIIFFKRIYDGFFKSHQSVDYNLSGHKKYIKGVYFSFIWYEVYDFIEFVSEIYSNEDINNSFRSQVNEVLENEMSGYRFVDGYIAPIIDKVEIDEIEEALASKIAGAKIHFTNALMS